MKLRVKYNISSIKIYSGGVVHCKKRRVIVEQDEGKQYGRQFMGVWPVWGLAIRCIKVAIKLLKLSKSSELQERQLILCQFLSEILLRDSTQLVSQDDINGTESYSSDENEEKDEMIVCV
ncbi:unnamed protein product [Orchesella dallaii]|uniref:Uncharacterized protein n=1 Tax=Orchesella dallaii TaxID=48710 RepID=A0ABP1Q5Z0_9HEXA